MFTGFAAPYFAGKYSLAKLRSKVGDALFLANRTVNTLFRKFPEVLVVQVFMETGLFTLALVILHSFQMIVGFDGLTKCFTVIISRIFTESFFAETVFDRFSPFQSTAFMFSVAPVGTTFFFI